MGVDARVGPVDDDRGHRRPGHARPAPGTLAIDAVFVTPLDHASGEVQVAVGRDQPHRRRARRVAPPRRSATTAPRIDGRRVPPGAGRVDALADLSTGSSRWEPVALAPWPSGPARADRARAVVGDRVATGARRAFGLRTARVRDRRRRARPPPRGQRAPGVRQGGQLHPVAALRRGRPLASTTATCA